MKPLPKHVTEAEAKKLVEDEWSRWTADEGSPEKLRQRIHGHLDSGLQEIVCKLMGFEKRWGGYNNWEIDHCNGRAGNSAIGDYLRTVVGESCRAWIDKHAGSLPELPRDAIASLKNEYIVTYREAVRKGLREIAEQRGRARAQRLIDEVLAAKEEPAPAVAAESSGSATETDTKGGERR